MKADEFNLILTDQDGNVKETVKNDKDGNVKLSALSFDKVGTSLTRLLKNWYCYRHHVRHEKQSQLQ